MIPLFMLTSTCTMGNMTPGSTKITIVQTAFVLLTAINQVTTNGESDRLTTRRHANATTHARDAAAAVRYPKCIKHREYLRAVNGTVNCVSCDHHCAVGWGIAVWCHGFMNTVCQECVDGETFSDFRNADSERFCRECTTCQERVLRNCTKFENTVCSEDYNDVTLPSIILGWRDSVYHHTVILWTTISIALVLIPAFIISIGIYIMKRKKSISKLINKKLHISFKRLNSCDGTQLLHMDGIETELERSCTSSDSVDRVT